MTVIKISCEPKIGRIAGDYVERTVEALAPVFFKDNIDDTRHAFCFISC